LHRTGDRAERAGRGVGARVYGMSQQVQHLKEEPKDFDDATLAHEVETEIFRDVGVLKRQINGNVQEGVVQLRGEVPDPDMLNDLVEKTRRVQGVRDVESLLHLPGTPAPMHE
jgi:osmotically-inducible protein OsmY